MEPYGEYLLWIFVVRGSADDSTRAKISPRAKTDITSETIRKTPERNLNKAAFEIIPSLNIYGYSMFETADFSLEALN